jgi:hypothetical protein
VHALQLTPPSELDPYLTLLDQDKFGNSPLVENNDIQSEVMTDSQIYYVIPETGTYYLKIKSSDHPTSGGGSYFYSIYLTQLPETADTTAPALSIKYPTAGDAIKSEFVEFSAEANDYGSGVSRVDFWWHSPDWNAGQWELLVSDAFGEDGWQASLNGNGLLEGQAGALVVIAYDWEGNSRAVVNWNIPVDDTPPVTALDALPAMTDGTGIRLSWNATDPYGQIDAYDIQYQMDGGGWLTWQASIAGSRRHAWFVGQPGHDYVFRMRGRDTAGNQETFPSMAEAGTQTASTCSVDSYDQDAGDGQAILARTLVLDELQDHNYCGVGDIDWVSFIAQADQVYLIWVLPEQISAAGSSLDLYQFDETNLILHDDAIDIGSHLAIRWVAPVDGLYLIRLTSLDGGIWGNNTSYHIRVGNGWWFNFPLIYLE